MNRKVTKRQGERGFTLMELLVVLVILGLLAAIATPRMVQLLGGAKQDTAHLQVSKLGGVLDLYRLEIGRYPTEQEGLSALVAAPADAEGWNGPYLTQETQIVDPWGTPFVYKFPGEHGEYDLMSLGADGKQGGDDEDADVTSW